MRRAFLSSALLVGGLLAAACTEQRSPLPTQAPSLTSSTLCDPTLATPIDNQIIALFPNKPELRGAARSQFTNIKRKCPSQIQPAIDMTVDLAGFASKKYQGGQLTPGTTALAVSQFIDLLYQYVGLPAPDISPDALGTSGGVAVIGLGGGQFTTGQGLAGLMVPPGSVSSDHLFTITRRDDLTPNGGQSTCLNTTLEQFPLCYDYSVFPTTTFNPPVTLAICQLETTPPGHPAGLALAHAAPGGNGIEILPVVGDLFPLTCTAAELTASKGLFNRLKALAMKLITPKMLYAGHSGLGGLTCCFSNFMAVRAKLDFVQQPTNTAAGATVTPAIKVAIENVETGAVAPEVTNPIRVAIGTNPAGGTLGGTTTQSPSSGVATFADLSIDKEGAGYTLTANALGTGGAPLPVSATSAAFNIGNSILIYGPSMSAPTQALPNNEQTLAEAAGYSVTVANAATWSSFSTADFARFNAIVFGDPSCTGNPSPVATANDNKATWSAAVRGPTVVIGTDPQLHSNAQAQAPQLITKGINFSARGSGTGLYVTLSCYYFNVSSATPVEFLSQLGDFQVIGQGFLTSGQLGCPGNVTIVAPEHPVMAGLTNDGLSNWSCSVHEFFFSFPSDFSVLATADRQSGETTTILPYIIARSP